ncbi:OCIA domain-containing protein [Trichinella spiralis]|uniref:OCIA domain-containing protein n=1 Tax=Trichinella spiralis TaxID=6334 RepID=A0ABR3L2W4_TRISP
MDNVVSFHLTFEEQNVLRECARESFIYRCLPLTVVGCFSAKYCQKSGLIKGHPISECKEKILKRIPNSNLANAVRKSNPSTIFQGNVGKRHDTTNSNGFRNEAEGDLERNSSQTMIMAVKKPRSMIQKSQSNETNDAHPAVQNELMNVQQIILLFIGNDYFLLYIKDVQVKMFAVE